MLSMLPPCPPSHCRGRGWGSGSPCCSLRLPWSEPIPLQRNSPTKSLVLSRRLLSPEKHLAVENRHYFFTSAGLSRSKSLSKNIRSEPWHGTGWRPVEGSCCGEALWVPPLGSEGVKCGGGGRWAAEGPGLRHRAGRIAVEPMTSAG